MMGGGLGPVLVGGMIAAGIIYSCGPNVIVGTVATTIYGGLSCRDKIKKILLENALANSPEGAQGYIRWKIKCAQKDLDHDLNRTGAFAVSIMVHHPNEYLS
jgi:hypothetical protein